MHPTHRLRSGLLAASLALGANACCSESGLGLRLVWENGTEERVRFGCGDAKAVAPGALDRSEYIESPGTQRVPVCRADETTPFVTVLLEVTALPTCELGRDLEVMVRLEPTSDGWRVVLPSGEDAAMVQVGIAVDGPVDTDDSGDTADTDTDGSGDTGDSADTDTDGSTDTGDTDTGDTADTSDTADSDSDTD